MSDFTEITPDELRVALHGWDGAWTRFVFTPPLDPGALCLEGPLAIHDLGWADPMATDPQLELTIGSGHVRLRREMLERAYRRDGIDAESGSTLEILRADFTVWTLAGPWLCQSSARRPSETEKERV